MRLSISFILVSLALLSGRSAFAQAEPVVYHEPLQLSASLDFAAMFTAALTNSPQSRAISVQQDTAQQRNVAGRAWTTVLRTG